MERYPGLEHDCFVFDKFAGQNALHIAVVNELVYFVKYLIESNSRAVKYLAVQQAQVRDVSYQVHKA